MCRVLYSSTEFSALDAIIKFEAQVRSGPCTLLGSAASPQFAPSCSSAESFGMALPPSPRAYPRPCSLDGHLLPRSLFPAKWSHSPCCALTSYTYVLPVLASSTSLRSLLLPPHLSLPVHQYSVRSTPYISTQIPTPLPYRVRSRG